MPSVSGTRRDEHFGKSQRLRKRREFFQVQQQGRKIHLRDLLVFVYLQKGKQRLGITASRKIGGAVQRNRVKRLLREVWRKEHHGLSMGYDIVFVVKRSAVTANFSVLRQQVLELGRKLYHLKHG